MEAYLPTQKIEKLSVTFDLEFEVTEIEKLQEAFAKATPGSANRDAIYSKLKGMYDYAVGRLDGELLAHGNIARKKLKELFKL